MEGRQLPAELLKIRLNQQLGLLKELLKNSKNDSKRGGQEDPFCLYQRIVSWFVMGRLSKHEYDRVLETLLESTELIELHNRVLELLRAIHCDSSASSASAMESASCPSLPAFAFNLLAAPERSLLSSSVSHEPSTPNVAFSTTIKLTQSEEILISEAMRTPILPLAFPASSASNEASYFASSAPADRLMAEVGRTLDHAEMRARIATIAEGEGLVLDGEAFDDGVSVLVCKVVEDFVKNLIQNAWELKFQAHSALQPPESFIFGFVEAEEREQMAGGGEAAQMLSERDFEVLLRVKPWLLADFLPELGIE